MIYKIKKTLSSPESEIWKAIVVMYILWFFFSDDKFDWWGNIAIAFVFLICGWIVICIASMLSFNRNKQPTILIVNDLIETAEKSVSSLHLIDGKTGVFKMSDTEYELVANPEKIYFKIKGMNDMLYSVGLMKSDETCAKLDRYLNELQVMIGHDPHDYYFYKTQKDS